MSCNKPLPQLSLRRPACSANLLHHVLEELRKKAPGTNSRLKLAMSFSIHSIRAIGAGATNPKTRNGSGADRLPPIPSTISPPRVRLHSAALYQALQAEGLWGLVDRVAEVQVENDRGISGTTKDNNRLILRLIENSHFCADTPIGGALHKGEKTWRQVVASAEGLHVGAGGKNQFSAHLDDLAPVAGREKDGQCRYSYRDLLPHLSSDVLGLKNIDFFPRPMEEPQPGEVQPIIRFRIPGT